MATQTATPGPRSAFDFFGETLAAAEGGKFTPEKYKHMVDDLADAAAKDLSIELVVVLRKGDNVALLGVKDGQSTSDGNVLGRILRPIVSRL